MNFAMGEARFSIEDEKKIPALLKGIHKLGYTASVPTHAHTHSTSELSSVEKKFYLSLIFTIPLFSHMFLPFHFLHNPLVQLALCIPVVIIGILSFGKSAWGSLKSGVPNMDVLITIGSNAAFFYSLAGTISYYGTAQMEQYLFYETAATIISLVLLGNVLEHRSIKQTTTAIEDLSKMQVGKAKKLVQGASANNEYTEVKYEDIVKEDILLVNTGDKIPVDGEIIWGEASVDESMISGESVPVEKNIGEKVIGGTLVIKGNVKVKAEKVGNETILAGIIELVKNAQNSKPSIQRLGDKVSAIFVPVVTLVSIITFLLSHFVFDISIQKALMSSIAVLVISCPCAMGLATPTAVMVGIGRAAKNGILIKGGTTLENFAGIKTIVFDKTGTLTTGNFIIKKINCFNEDGNKVKSILYNLEQHSSHPIAKSIVLNLTGFQNLLGLNFEIKEIKEEKGLGIFATDTQDNHYQIGSYSIAQNLTKDNSHTVYLVRNNVLLATVDIEDEIKSNAKETITALKQSGIKTILLSGDSLSKCEEIAKAMGIDEVYAERLPHQKLELIEKFVSNAPTAMVGDGINDAPALAKATIGISLSNATQVAIHSAQIILLKGDLSYIPKALSISKHTLLTIKQNLFWAFLYNVVAIPIAAVGLLSPMIGALSMAFSDVVVIGNSIRLKTKKIFR